jgi:hypothetical protein
VPSIYDFPRRILSRFWSLFLVPRTTVSCLHCCTTKYVSHHWSTPHCCSPTYTIHSNIQYQLSSILQFFLHMRCFYTATYSDEYLFAIRSSTVSLHKRAPRILSCGLPRLPLDLTPTSRVVLRIVNFRRKSNPSVASSLTVLQYCA